ncbi:MAG: hypothetical protein ACLR8Y_08055 [Alistipes indistinctus]
MRERIATLVPGGMSRSLWMEHFPLGFRPHPARRIRLSAAGCPSSFTIYDSADAKNLVKLAIKELNLSGPETYKPNVVAARISKAKNNLVTPQAYEERTGSLQREGRRPRAADSAVPRHLQTVRAQVPRERRDGLRRPAAEHEYP